jgi:Cu-Zn family superoxide dismutase
MKRIYLSLGMGLLLISTACENKSETVVVDASNDTVETLEDDVMDSQIENDESTLNLTFSPASGSNLSGTASLTQNGEEVTLQVDIVGVTPGEHAIHVHEIGDCSSADATSAGGHWNPTNDEHGKFDMGAFHMGDIGNLNADADGKASLTFSTDKWCIGCDDDTKNLIGRSIIIHEGVDDFETQPTGDAGGRIGCVVIE